MIGALDRFADNPAAFAKMGAEVGAVSIQHSRLSGAGPEDHQIFAEIMNGLNFAIL